MVNFSLFVDGHHIVELVPGIVIGGLELWEGRSCAEGLFRKRLWVIVLFKSSKGVIIIKAH